MIKNIPKSLYEAAKVEGANAWQRFYKITLPLSTPMIFYNAVMSIIGTLQYNGTLTVASNNGKGVDNSLYLYGVKVWFEAFRSGDIGYGAALSWLLFIIVAILTFILFSSFIFSQEKIDSIILKVANDVSSKCNSKTILCILDFNSPSQDLSEYIQTELTSHVTENGMKVVTRSNMDKVDNELNYQLSGFISDETALSICKRLGANAIVFGQIKELDNKYNLQVRLLDVESASYILFKTYVFSRSSKSEQLLGRAANYYKMSIGIFAEVNKNSISYIAPAAGIYFDYSFFRKISLGGKLIASYDAFEKENTVYSLEPLAVLRVYLVSPSGEPSTGFYLEGTGGADIIFSNENVHTVFDAGAGFGFRKEFDSFYIEPMARFGYPYIFEIGFGTGLRF